MASIGIPDILVYLTTLDGLGYYVATHDPTIGYVLNPAPILAPTPILNLPMGWEDTSIKWSRHPQYLGLFRSQSEEFTFVKDARSILLGLFYQSGGGIQAVCKMRIDIFVDVLNGYDTAYISDIDFSQIVDNKYENGSGGTSGNPPKEGELKVNTLDSELFTLLQAYGDTVFNVPIWTNSSGNPLAPIWVTDAKFVLHDGIKLLYNATFVSSASPTSILPIRNLSGFSGGRHSPDPASGVHYLFSLTSYNPVQNNGSTTFIGNDILNIQLIQGTQQFYLEINFNNDENDSHPYSRDRYSLKNALPFPPNTFKMNVAVSGSISDGGTFVYGITGGNAFMKVVIFEIDSNDNPIFGAGGIYTCQTLFEIDIPDYSTSGGIYVYTPITFSTYDNPVEVNINPDKVYVVGIIFDNVTGSLPGSSFPLDFSFDAFQVSFLSKYDSGMSGVPIPAPQLNPSVFPAFTLKQLLQKIIPYLGTTNTDLYGFPIVSPTNIYGGASDFLDSNIEIADCAPKQIAVTSQYCVHDLQGQSYISISLNQLWKFCFNHLGCGLSINLLNSNLIEIERLSTYFDSLTEIFDLGTNVSKLSIKPFNDLGGSNLKIGYTKADTNSDFGVDSFNTEIYFDTPLSKLPNKIIDWEEGDFVTDQYAIEKIRAQKVTQSIGISYDPANPSTDNQIIALYCQPDTRYIILPNEDVGSPYNFQPIDPSNNLIPCNAHQLTQRNGLIPFGGFPTPYSTCMQNTDVLANTNPFAYGLYYPDSAINLELSPCRTLQRDCGALLHSVLDLMDGQSLIFRQTAVMQYNNVAQPLTGIQSNLQIGKGLNPIVEFADKQISNLPNKLFRPFIFSIETVSPVNMYNIMKTNPNGYIQFEWKGIIFKGFIWSISQKLSVSQPTTFELLAHPDTTNQQLIQS